MDLPTMPDFDPALLEDGNEVSAVEAIAGLMASHTTEMLAEGTFALMCDQMIGMLIAPFEGEERAQAVEIMANRIMDLA